MMLLDDASLIDIEAGIDVWLAHYRSFSDDGLIERLRAMLDPDECAQERRFLFADDSRRYLVTRALVRSVLSRYAPVAPRAWTFVTNRYGRPEIAPAHVIAGGLRFNLSHTRGLIALAVSRARELGIDVENVAAREFSLSIARRYFAASEVAALAAVAPERQHQRLFEYWTLKEAYIKARGMGLSLPLEQFAFEFPSPGTVALTIAPELGDEPERWRLWQYEPAAGFTLALCAERLEEGAPAVSLRVVEPDGSTAPLEIRPLRVSGAPELAAA